MGWELRKSHWYLYSNRRVNGRPMKEYLAAEGDFGSVIAHSLSGRQEAEAQNRRLQRNSNSNFLRDIETTLAIVSTENAKLKLIVEGALVALGFRNHHRGEWRMTRNNGLANLPSKGPTPLINFEAPKNDSEAVELFAKARSGDIDAVIAVRKFLVQRKWVEYVGNLATQAAARIISRGTAGDEVWRVAIEEKLATMWVDLGGETASMLEKLLMRRVLNGWLAVHMLEIQQSTRPPTLIKQLECLDRALSKAQRRYVEAITGLARIRRLNLPVVLAQVNVTGNQAIINKMGT